MELINVNREKCISCGACSDVCPRRIITMDDGFPRDVYPTTCIACGHCVAVCPTKALDNVRSPLSGQTPIEEQSSISSAAARQFLRSRRSIRKYKQQPVPGSVVRDLLDVARLAPTGGNSQGISFIVIREADVLRQITALTIDWLEEAVAEGSEWAQKYAGYVRAYRNDGEDTVLRNAPCFILATAAAEFTRGRENSCFALAYAELYAPALGLGTCWAGIFEACIFAGYQPMIKLLNLPAGKVVTAAIMAGYPQYKYHRLVDRNPLAITFGVPGK